jgi:hypothetical protein
MGEKATFAVQVDKDSELYEDFNEYQDRRGFTSRSETLRHLMRAEFDDDDEPVGVAAALSKVAGEQLTEQLGILSRYVIAMAVALMAIEFGLPGGALWFVPVVFFGFLTFTTTLGVAVGFADVLDVTAGQTTSTGATSESSDEVDA